MEGRSKSRFSEKCKNGNWGRFPSQFWSHFEAPLAPKMHFLQKKRLLKISPPKSIPESETAAGSPYGQTGWLPESPPSRTHFSNKKQLFEQLLQHCSGFVANKVNRCKQKWTGCWKCKSSSKLWTLLPKVRQLVETVVCGYGVDTWWFCSWSPTVAVWSLTFFFLIASRRWRSQIRPELGWRRDRLWPTTFCK